MNLRGLPARLPGRRARRRADNGSSAPASGVAALSLSLALGLLSLPAPGPAAAQDTNILAPTDSIEAQLAFGYFEIIDRRGSRFEGDRTSRVALTFGDGVVMAVKWAPAPVGGERFNNVPRYEAAAYALQKVFLDEPDFVVPPTVIRAFPLGWYRELDDQAVPTFFDTEAVLVTLQYWLFNVTPDDFWDRQRFRSDPTYARHFADFNILSYLIRHGDENAGNVLISTFRENPRVFAVDNGIAFASPDSDRGHHWSRLRVDRVPADAIARLRALTRAELEARLQTVAEFRVLPDGRLQPVDPGPVLDPEQGIRRAGDRIQLGLTRAEIGDVWGRIQSLLERVDRGRLETF